MVMLMGLPSVVEVFLIVRRALSACSLALLVELCNRKIFLKI